MFAMSVRHAEAWCQQRRLGDIQPLAVESLALRLTGGPGGLHARHEPKREAARVESLVGADVDGGREQSGDQLAR